MTIGLAAAVGAGTASFAQLAVPGPGEPGIEAGERRADQRFGGNTGISLAVPIGSVSVDPQTLGGEAIYVRRVTVREGMTVVEVSTTPFEPVLTSNQGSRRIRPDQPAGW